MPMPVDYHKSQSSSQQYERLQLRLLFSCLNVLCSLTIYVAFDLSEKSLSLYLTFRFTQWERQKKQNWSQAAFKYHT